MNLHSFLLVIALSALITGCTNTGDKNVPQQLTFQGKWDQQTFYVQQAFNRKYRDKGGAKAFAVSENNAHGYFYEVHTLSNAIEAALDRCKVESGIDATCEILHSQSNAHLPLSNGVELSDKAWTFYHETYLLHSNPKALAIGPTGSMGYAGGFETELVKETALRECETYSAKQNNPAGLCRLIDVDGNLLEDAS